MEINQEKEKVLKQTAKEYFDSAEEEFKKERFNSSGVLYFKSLVALADLFFLKKTGNTPPSHTARFNLAKSQFPKIYDLLDKDFPFYQDSYVQIMTKELAEIIKNDTKEISRKIKFKI